MRKEDKVLQVQSTDLFSDAGEHMMGGVQFEGKHIAQGSVFKQYFSEEESRMLGTFRELRAIEEGIRIREEQFRGHRIRWGVTIGQPPRSSPWAVRSQGATRWPGPLSGWS